MFIRDVSSKTDGIQFGPHSWQLNVSLWAIGLLFISSLACLIIGPLMRRLLTFQHGGTAIKVTYSKQIRGDMLNYTLPFLIGLFAFDYNSGQSIISLLVFLTFMFSFVHKEQVSLLNPMFLLMGMRLYSISYKEVGRTPDYEKTVLCLGEVIASSESVNFKENAGINFIFPKAVTKESN